MRLSGRTLAITAGVLYYRAVFLIIKIPGSMSGTGESACVLCVKQKEQWTPLYCHFCCANVVNCSPISRRAFINTSSSAAVNAAGLPFTD